MFAEICTSARTECPQPAVEQFLILHDSLALAVTIAEALSATRGDANSDEPKETSPEKSQLVSEKLRDSSHWVTTALSADLASFSLHERQALGRSSLRKSPSQHMVVLLEGPPSTGLKLLNAPALTPYARNSLTSISSKPAFSSVSQSENERKRENGAFKPQSPMKVPASPARRNSSKVVPLKNGLTKSVSTKETSVELSWVKGRGLVEVADLGKQLQVDAQNWFLQFMEGALDRGFQVSDGNGAISLAAKVVSQSDNSQIASMLSQLKRVNDWLDQVREEGLDVKAADTKSRLKRKIYEFLLQHVESAASALGNVSSVLIAPKTGSQRARRDSSS